jgi:AcrR family transcriptional regulator
VGKHVTRSGSVAVSTTRDDQIDDTADWQRRVIGRSLRTAVERSVDRGSSLIRAAAIVLARSDGEDITVQAIADEAGQSLRTLYQYFESKDDLMLAVFEEAMRTYASLIERSISDLADPLDRLAGAIIAAMRMPELRGTGIERGLVRLRVKLSEVEPGKVGRAQRSMTILVKKLVEAASATGQIRVTDPDAAAFMLLSLNAAYTTAEMFGNDSGVPRPDVAWLTSVCLRGFGAELGPDWYETLLSRLSLPSDRMARSGSTRRSKGTIKRATEGP